MPECLTPHIKPRQKIEKMKLLSVLLFVSLGVCFVSGNCGCLNCNPNLRVVSGSGSPFKVIYRNYNPPPCQKNIGYSVQVPVPSGSDPDSSGAPQRCYGYQAQPGRADPSDYQQPCPQINFHNYQAQIPVVENKPYSCMVGLVGRPDRVVMPAPPTGNCGGGLNPVFDTYDCDGEGSSRYEYQPKTLLYRVTSSASPRLRGKRTVDAYLWKRQYLAPRSSRLVDSHNKLHSKTKHFRTKNVRAGAQVFNNEWRNVLQTISQPPNHRFYLQGKPKCRPLLSRRLGLQNQDLLHEQELVNTVLRRDRISTEPHLRPRKKRGIIQNLREQKRLRLSRRQGENEIEDFTEIEDANGRKIFDKSPEKPRLSLSERPRSASSERPRPVPSERPIRPASPERVSSYRQPRAYEPVLQSPAEQTTNVFSNMLNVPLKCVGKFAEMSQPLVTEAIPKMIRFSSNAFKNMAQKVKRNIMGPGGVRRKPLVRGRRLKRNAAEPQSLDLFMSFLVPFLQDPTGFLTSFLAPKREPVEDNLVETRKRRSIVDGDSECEVEYKAVKAKIEELLENIQALLSLDLESNLPIYRKLSHLQQVKDVTLETWTSLAFEAQPQNLSPLLTQLKNLSDLRDDLFSGIIKGLYSNNSTSLQNEKWIKILVRLLKLKCLIYNVLEDISSSSLTGLKQVEYLDVLGKLNFTHATTDGEVLEELELERDSEIEEQASALGKLQGLLREEERHDFKNIKEEAKVLWEISNVKKLQRDAILELGKKFEAGAKIGKELRIIFDLQDRLEDCEKKQALILNSL